MTVTVAARCAEPDGAMRLVGGGDMVWIEVRRGVDVDAVVSLTVGEFRRAVVDFLALMALDGARLS